MAKTRRSIRYGFFRRLACWFGLGEANKPTLPRCPPPPPDTSGASPSDPPSDPASAPAVDAAVAPPPPDEAGAGAEAGSTPPADNAPTSQGEETTPADPPPPDPVGQPLTQPPITGPRQEYKPLDRGARIAHGIGAAAAGTAATALTISAMTDWQEANEANERGQDNGSKRLMAAGKGILATVFGIATVFAAKASIEGRSIHSKVDAGQSR